MITKNRKIHSKRDLIFMEKLYQGCVIYIPHGIRPHDNLYLMQDLIKARPKFEITSSKELKSSYAYGFLGGFYAAIQYHNGKETERNNIKEFLKADYLRTLPKDNEKGPDYTTGI
tara:strand:- start:435 stop:779 length:345 start_codon:yes stop_codon:yes gene_type:complete